MGNILYKYLDTNGAIMMLHYSNLMYANATTFNDPFDCHPSLIDVSNISINDNDEWPKKMAENELFNYRENLWICCLSKVCDSLLMWSYYNKHEGVCIGLNMDKVAKCIDVRYGVKVTPYGKDVQYEDVVSKPNYYLDKEDFSIIRFTQRQRRGNTSGRLDCIFTSLHQCLWGYFHSNIIKIILIIKK